MGEAPSCAFSLVIKEVDEGLIVRFSSEQLNASGVCSRAFTPKHNQIPTAPNPFRNMVIRNSEGGILLNTDLFSFSMQQELNKYFEEHKRGPMAKLKSLKEWKVGLSETSPGNKLTRRGSVAEAP